MTTLDVNAVQRAWDAATSSPSSDYPHDKSGYNLTPDELKVLKGMLSRIDLSGEGAHELLNMIAEAAAEVYSRNSSEAIYSPASALKSEARKMAAEALRREPSVGAAFDTAMGSGFAAATGNLTPQEMNVLTDMVKSMQPTFEDHPTLNNIARTASDVYSGNSKESVYGPAANLRRAADAKAAKALDTIA